MLLQIGVFDLSIAFESDDSDCGIFDHHDQDAISLVGDLHVGEQAAGVKCFERGIARCGVVLAVPPSLEKLADHVGTDVPIADHGDRGIMFRAGRQGRLDLDAMVTKRGRLGDINEAFRAMKAGEVARTVLTFD